MNNFRKEARKTLRRLFLKVTIPLFLFLRRKLRKNRFASPNNYLSLCNIRMRNINEHSMDRDSCSNGIHRANTINFMKITFLLHSPRSRKSERIPRNFVTHVSLFHPIETS